MLHFQNKTCIKVTHKTSNWCPSLKTCHNISKWIFKVYFIVKKLPSVVHLIIYSSIGSGNILSLMVEAAVILRLQTFQAFIHHVDTVSWWQPLPSLLWTVMAILTLALNHLHVQLLNIKQLYVIKFHILVTFKLNYTEVKDSLPMHATNR